MPIRKVNLITKQYYHIINKSFGKIKIFSLAKNNQRAVNLINYYRFKNSPLSFSNFLKLNQNLQTKILNKLKKENNCLVKIIAFCLMPNHFHFLLKQLSKNGILNFMQKFQNAYAKYYNLKNERKGPVFDNRFKAVLISNNEQLLHVSRYIHLNPYSSSIVKSKQELLLYPWSSLPQYLNKTKGFCHPQIVLDQFSKPSEYQQFIFNQADYQKHLNFLKTLTPGLE